MKAQWRDTSSFSRNDTDRTPKTWHLDAGRIGITVTRHTHYPGTWLMRCGFVDMLDLNTDDVDMAKERAVSIVRRYLADALNYLS